MQSFRNDSSWIYSFHTKDPLVFTICDNGKCVTRVSFQVTTRAPEIRIRGERDCAGGGGGDDVSSVEDDKDSSTIEFGFGKIFTVNKDCRSMVALCEKVPSQQVFGQHICALLNNQKRGE